jgi:glucoamylase
MITYANWLIANSNTTFVTNTLWPIIKLDLDYVSTFWNQSRYRYAHFLAYFTYKVSRDNSFDLWEEINSSSFFTTAVQHRALREGITLAQKIGQTSVVSDYATQADNTLCFLQVRMASNGTENL